MPRFDKLFQWFGVKISTYSACTHSDFNSCMKMLLSKISPGQHWQQSLFLYCNEDLLTNIMSDIWSKLVQIQVNQDLHAGICVCNGWIALNTIIQSIKLRLILFLKQFYYTVQWGSTLTNLVKFKLFICLLIIHLFK